MNKKAVFINILKAAAAVLSAIILLFAFIYVTLIISFSTSDNEIYIFLLMIAAALFEITVICSLWGFIKRKICYIPLCAAFGLCAVSFIGHAAYRGYIKNIPTVGESGDLLTRYAPYAEDSPAVTLNDESELTITSDFPVMDGATALYPIYSAFAKAVYPKEILEDMVIKTGNKTKINENKFLKCSKTTQAYKNIVTGDADIIFVASPSDEQKLYAEQNGVELKYTPIGKEAFVFFVNAKNPIENITVSEIQKIYSGKITDWSQLGIQNLGKIRAFQRDEGSGSQSALIRLMEGQELMTPPKEDVIGDMGAVITQTADYKNYKNAIGYSFRFYATEMVKSKQIKLLSINGTYPNLENIENNTYPLASEFYAVTRSDADTNTQKLLEWICGSQGGKIIEMTGYTPLK